MCAALASRDEGNDVVICCYLDDHNLTVNGQKLLTDVFESKGVSRYVASEFSLDFTKLELGKFPAKDPMKYVKQYIYRG